MGSGTQTSHRAWQWHPYPLSLLDEPRLCSSVRVETLVSIARNRNPWQSVVYDSVRSEQKCVTVRQEVGAGQSCCVFQSSFDEPARNTLDSHNALDFEFMFGYDLS